MCGALRLGLAPAAQATDGVVLINQATGIHGLPGCEAGWPILICKPGSYRLSGNWTAPLNRNAVQISSDDVTFYQGGAGEMISHVTAEAGIASGTFGTGLEIRDGAIEDSEALHGSAGMPSMGQGTVRDCQTKQTRSPGWRSSLQAAVTRFRAATTCLSETACAEAARERPARRDGPSCRTLSSAWPCPHPCRT